MEKVEIELILVYNAESGFFNVIKDGLHKIVAPSTYQCNLCALTYGKVMMKDEWRGFIEQLEIPATFLHRDEFLKRLESHPHDIEKISFPAIFLDKGGKISLFIGSVEINKCNTLNELIELITNKISSIKKR